MWGSNEGRALISLGGVGHIELSEGFFGLTMPKGFACPKCMVVNKGGQCDTF